MVKNDIFGMKMISIKMFYYLLRFNCLPASSLDSTKRMAYHTHAKNASRAFHFSHKLSASTAKRKRFTLFVSSHNLLIICSVKLQCTYRENKMQPHKMRSRTFILGTSDRAWHCHISIDCSQWIRIPNMVKTHYSENCTHKYRIHARTIFWLKSYVLFIKEKKFNAFILDWKIFSGEYGR